MQRITFKVGEQRYVRLLVHATNGDAFLIRDARWELIGAGCVESEGECLIQDHEISAYIKPQKRVTYQLRIIYRVADETLIAVIEVAVT